MVEPASGDIVACTQLEPTGRKQPFDTALARFTSTGAVDTTFGTDGVVNVAGVGGCAAVAALSNGDIVVENGPSTEFNSSGVEQSTVTGGTLVASGGSENPPSLGSIFEPNTDYLAAQAVFTGEESRGHNAAAQVVRYTVTGATDTTFNNSPFHFQGSGGFGIEALPNAVAFASNGDVVVAGEQVTYAQSGMTTVNGLARLTSTGALDTTFADGGVLTNSVPSGTTGFDGVVIDPEGRIVVIGGTSSETTVFVSRFLGD
jgi:uncharacterized delta-60 repeat protein